MLSHFQLLAALKAVPHPVLILQPGPEYSIETANQAYLQTLNTGESFLRQNNFIDLITGGQVFQFADNGDQLKGSLEQVMATRAVHQMPVQQCDIHNHNSGKHQTKYLKVVNTPVLNKDGEVDFIIHSFADVTDQHRIEIQKNAELIENQQRLDKAYRLARIGTWEYDMITEELHWSTITKEVHGFGPDYIPDVQSTIEMFKEGIDRDTFAQAVENALERYEPFDVEQKITSGQGDDRWIRATGEPEFADGVCIRFYGISQNVSERKKAEESLMLSEQRFKALVQDGSDLIAILDANADYQYVSPTSQRVLGMLPEHYIGTNVFSYIHEEDRQRLSEHLANLSVVKQIQIEPFKFLDNDGNYRWIESTITNMIDDPAVQGLVANSRDVTQQKLAQQQILDSLKEKDTLLAEIHHRVKNNLAVVSALMQLQAHDEENDDVKGRLYDCVVRIKSMANIHEQLYQSNNFSDLDVANNIKILVTDILDTFQVVIPIDITYHCGSVRLNIVQAIPFSLVINEVITNILKHAFPGRNKGAIVISLSETKDQHLLLTVKDDGVGLPEHFDVTRSSSLGVNLIKDLSEQLAADMKFESPGGGTTFTLRFKINEGL